MKLTTRQSYELLAKHGCYIKEVCGKCGRGIGPVCFSRKDESGAWCSRECRDGKEARTPGTCRGCGAKLPEDKRRGAFFCDNACKQAAHRHKLSDSKLSVTKPSIYAGFCKVPGQVAIPIAGRPKTALSVTRKAHKCEIHNLCK